MSMKLSPSLAQKLLFYGVSTGAVAMAASARADMFETPAGISGNNIYFDPASGAFSTTDASLEFSLTTTTTTGTNPKNGNPKTTTVASANGGVALNSNNYVINSPSTIDGSLTYGNGPLNEFGTNTVFTVGMNDTFQPGGSGTIGLEEMVNGVEDFGSADITFNGFGAAQGTFTLTDFQYTTVPEPSTVALLVAGAAGAAVWRRRRQQARNAA